MRYRMFVVVVGIVMLMPGVLAAQEDETWYFAWKPETGEVVAYTAAGEVNTILEDVRAYRLLRLDEQSALLVAGVDGLFVLYKLMPDGVQRLEPQFDENLMVEEQIRIGAFIIPAIHLPYVLMTFNNALYIPELLLINTDEGTAQRLDAQLLDTTNMCGVAVYGHNLDQCARFSLDGDKLRYLANPETLANGEIWALRERILTSGEERVIYTYSDPAPDTSHDRVYCEPDTYGERWICQTVIEHNRSSFTEFWMLHSNGDRESIKVVHDLPDWQWHIFFSDENLVIIENLCETNCEIEVHLPDGTSFLFSLPNDYSLRTLPINDVSLLDRDRLLIFTGDPRYILSSDGILTELGSGICCHYPNSLSPDGRWLITLIMHQDNSDNTFQVWDVFNEKVVLEFSISFGYRGITYLDYGFIVRGLGERSEVPYNYHHIVYSYESGTILEPPDTVGGRFVEIWQDNNLLYEQIENYQDKLKGIYLYDRENDEYTLLVSGGEQIPQFEQ